MESFADSEAESMGRILEVAAPLVSHEVYPPARGREDNQPRALLIDRDCFLFH